eukprot:Partr_v1_DN28957_c1_g1_i3_m25593
MIIFRVLILLCLSAAYIVKAASLFNALLFPPAIIRTSDDPTQFSLTIRGMIYQFKSTHVQYTLEEGGTSKYLGSKLISVFGRLKGSKNMISVRRSLNFIALAPMEKSISIALSISSERQLWFTDPERRREWKDYGKMFVTARKDFEQEIRLDNVALDPHGYFQVNIPVVVKLGTDDSSALTGGDPGFVLDAGKISNTNGNGVPVVWLQAHLDIDQQSQFRLVTETKTTVVGLSNNELQILSDVDDTVKLSGVNHGISTLVDRAMLEEYKPVDGMPELFRHIEAVKNAAHSKASFHFLSASPWPMLTPYVNEFFIPFKFPWASVSSKPAFPGQRTLKCENPNPQYKPTPDKATTEETSCVVDDEDDVSEEFVDGTEYETPQKQGRLRRAYEKFKLWFKKYILRRKDLPPSPPSSSQKKHSQDVSPTVMRLYWGNHEHDNAEKVHKNMQSSSFRFKKARINEMLSGSSTWNNVMFFGDSTEADAEAAFWMSDVFRFRQGGTTNMPGKISCIFLRFVPPDTKNARDIVIARENYASRVKFMFSRIPGYEKHVRIFDNARDLMKLDFASAQCYNDNSYDAIWKRVDETHVVDE